MNYGEGLITVRKRPYPLNGKCEICGRKTRLDYHHWGEVKRYHFVKGIWCCRRKCHDFIELVENPKDFYTIINKYIELKETIDNAAVYAT